MMWIWNRRRPSLGKRLLSSILIPIAVTGLGVGAELLRRRRRISPEDGGRIRVVRRVRARAPLRRRVIRRRSRMDSAPQP